MKVIYLLTVVISLACWLVAGYKILLDQDFWSKVEQFVSRLWDKGLKGLILAEIALCLALCLPGVNLICDFYLIKLMNPKLN